MNAEQKILSKVAEAKDEGYANACELWKGYGDMGQRPNGWWLKPFGENARHLGSSVDEVTEGLQQTIDMQLEDFWGV